MRTGILGGTFNPIHLGHVKLANYFFEKLNLDRVFIIPTGVPSHKKYDAVISNYDRLNMCKLAFNNEKFIVNDLEIRRGGLSYTVDTLSELKMQYPNDEFFLFMGADMFLSLRSWRNYKDIFKMCSLCAAPRNDENSDTLKEFALDIEKDGASSYIADIFLQDVSSTEIREKLFNNKSIDDLVPKEVIDYIEKNSLYS